jgi:hypothetical protein
LCHRDQPAEHGITLPIGGSRLIGYRSAWWASYAALSIVGAFGYMRTHVKSRTVPFAIPEHAAPVLSERIRKLTSWQIVFTEVFRATPCYAV